MLGVWLGVVDVFGFECIVVVEVVVLGVLVVMVGVRVGDFFVVIVGMM